MMFVFLVIQQKAAHSFLELLQLRRLGGFVTKTEPNRLGYQGLSLVYAAMTTTAVHYLVCFILGLIGATWQQQPPPHCVGTAA